METEELQKIRAFLFFHIDQTITKKAASQFFLKNSPFTPIIHWEKASRNYLGATHLMFQTLNHHPHKAHDSEQWMNKWSDDSMWDLHRTHVASSSGIMPHRRSFSFVLILPNMENHRNNSIRGGTSPRHTPLITSLVSETDYFASSFAADFTEKEPDFSGVQMSESLS